MPFLKRLSFHFFWSFKTNIIIIFATDQCEKIVMSIQYTAPGFEPQPLEREPLPITTRPGLPPQTIALLGTVVSWKFTVRRQIYSLRLNIKYSVELNNKKVIFSVRIYLRSQRSLVFSHSIRITSNTFERERERERGGFVWQKHNHAKKHSLLAKTPAS